ncbi:MAG: hypothetical protein NVSMB2_04660 [Chloroflexota bacterium]
MGPPITRRALLVAGAVSVGTALGLARLSRFRASPAQPSDQRIALGDLTLAVRADPWNMSVLAPDGSVMWAEPQDQPLGFTTTDGRPAWAQRLISVQTLSDGGVHLVAQAQGVDASALIVEVRALSPRSFRLTVTPDTPASVDSVSGALTCTPDEHLVGLGERFDAVDQRGLAPDVWAEDRRIVNYGTSSYAPMPLVLSSHGHSFALERFERAHFDLAKTARDRWTWQQDAQSASLVIGYGPDLKTLVRDNVSRTGLPPLPAIWAFGVWKTAVGGQARVLDEMRRFRDLKVPLSAVFAYDAVDVEANIGWPTVTFGGREAGPYPDHVAYTSALHALGMKALNYFSADYHLERSNYNEPASHAFLVRRADGRVYVHPAFNIGWLDLTDPDAVLWWSQGWTRALSDLGYDGGMLDLGELLPADAVLADGSTGLESHNRYPLLYAQAAWQIAHKLRADKDIALIVRSAALGSQRFASGHWNGDAVMRWSGPDGLQSMVPAGVSAGLSGIPFWHAEVAGYVQADLGHEGERELWLRWLQLGTWTALLRDHLGDQPTAPIDVWSDQDTLAAFQQAARVHASLVPYLYSVARDATRDGLPLVRHMALEFPSDARAWTETQQYFLGSTFLVAPVVERGALSRSVYLPAGEWVDYWRGTVYEGGRDVTVAAPLDGPGPPVFARAGAVIPLAADHDTLVAGDTPTIQAWAGDLIVRVMPSRAGASALESSFELYDGTRLRWTGSVLEISNNAQPRNIEVRLTDGTVRATRVEGSTAHLS